MTCQECEIKLGMGEDAREHLASCAECRWLAQELRLNSYALREMRVRPVMQWVLAAAAAVVVAIAVWKMPVAPRRHPEIMAAHGAAPQLQLQQRQTVVPLKKVHRKRKAAPPMEPLRVKMFTSDPDVVIYWIVDKKEGFE